MLHRSIVVPLYQERGRIESTVRRLAASPLHHDGTEFLFVDDGSTDGTVDVLIQAIDDAGLARARVIRLPGNRGKGAAVRAGVLASQGAVVAFVDADLSSPPSAVLQCLEAVERGAHVAIASRAHPTSDITVRQPAGREGAGKAFNRLIRMLGLTSLPDTQCGLKAFDSVSARRLFLPLTIRRFAFDVEVLARAADLGMRVEVVPSEWAHVEQSRVSPLRDGARMAADALRVARARRRAKASPLVAAADAMSVDTFAAMAQVEQHHWWFAAKRRLVRQHLDECLTAAARDTAVDVGCGTGALLDELRGAGFRRVVGSDVEPAALRHAAARQPKAAQLVLARAEALPLRDAQVSVVTSLDVVEHLDDDVQALWEYQRILQPGGHLLITVPAYDWAWSGHDIKLGHRRRYTRGQVEEALAAAGYVEVRVRYFHSWLVPLALVLRRAPGGGRSLVPGECGSIGGRAQNAVGHALSRLDRALRLPFGLSIFASARRPA